MWLLYTVSIFKKKKRVPFYHCHNPQTSWPWPRSSTHPDSVHIMGNKYYYMYHLTHVKCMSAVWYTVSDCLSVINFWNSKQLSPLPFMREALFLNSVHSASPQLFCFVLTEVWALKRCHGMINDTERNIQFVMWTIVTRVLIYYL
jgi:hypothetical protein